MQPWDEETRRTVAAIVAAVPIARELAGEMSSGDLLTFHEQLSTRCAEAGITDRAAVCTAGALVVLDRDRAAVRAAREAAAHKRIRRSQTWRCLTIQQRVWRERELAEGRGSREPREPASRPAPECLSNALQCVARWGSPMTAASAPHVVAIAAHKGGVGKTTTAIALSAALARGGQRTLLVDLDPQGHSTIGLGVEPDSRTVRDLLAEKGALPLGQVEYATGVEGLVVVPANIGLERAARGMLSVMLRRALAPAGGRFAWVILDCPPSLGPLVENALVAASQVIVPVRSEARGADGLVDLLDVLELLNERAREACRILRTQRNESHSIANGLIEDALEPYRARVLQTMIPQCSELNQAQAKRQDIFSYAPRSTGAAAYAQLAGEVMGLWDGASSTT